tara:strand:- start:380 stop:544 length:165 start_codon:yes stop_codon:yes gene_type:complete
MALFVGVEVTTYYLLVDGGLAPGEALVESFNEEVMALWSSIIAFWFGGRQFAKK